LPSVRNDEAAHRSAISRAYYAAFHTARAYLEHHELEIDRSGGAHRQIQRVFQAIDAAIRQDLLRLHEWRKDADYDDPCSFVIETQALESLDLARSLVDRIKALT
jgi:uncharacterized protein (UPF0332 family)